MLESNSQHLFQDKGYREGLVSSTYWPSRGPESGAQHSLGQLTNACSSSRPDIPSGVWAPLYVHAHTQFYFSLRQPRVSSSLFIIDAQFCCFYLSSTRIADIHLQVQFEMKIFLNTLLFYFLPEIHFTYNSDRTSCLSNRILQTPVSEGEVNQY